MAISVGIGVLLVIGLAGVSATVRGLLHWSKTISTHPRHRGRRRSSGMPDAKDGDSLVWSWRAIVGRRVVWLLRGITRGSRIWGIIGHFQGRSGSRWIGDQERATRGEENRGYHE